MSSEFTVTIYLNTTEAKYRKAKSALKELPVIEAQIKELEKQGDSEELKEARARLALLQVSAKYLVSRFYGGAQGGKFREKIEEGATAPYAYTFEAGCREAIVTEFRRCLKPFALTNWGTLNTNSYEEDGPRLFNGKMQLTVKNNFKNLSPYGEKNLYAFCTSILTRNRTLDISFANDTLYVDCALWPVLVSSILWVWRRFKTQLNSKPHWDKRTWRDKATFKAFWEKEYSKALERKRSSVSNFNLFWLYAGEFLDGYYYGSVANLGEDNYNGPERWMGEKLGNKNILSRLRLRWMWYNTKGVSKLDKRLASRLEEILCQYSTTFALRRDISQGLDRVNKAKGFQAELTELSKFLEKLEIITKQSHL